MMHGTLTAVVVIVSLLSDLGSGNECWYVFRGHAYKVFENKKVTFDEAEKACKEKYGHLASIHSKEENDFIYGLAKKSLPKVSHDDLCWIGLWKSSKGWTWTDGSSVNYTNWAPGEPNNVQNAEYCTQLYNVDTFKSPMNWNDYDCTRKMSGYVCKI
uniref:C-type lectin-1 n=1 Tax=Heligmosomoides polygyrus TaxID=6339 RepID=D2D3S1_HELPZ|nr:C-type lectin-1 [Heligmosomoides polygyrus]